MTIIIDDAGSGDLLFGVVIGAYRSETQEFKYDMVGVRFFQSHRFLRKEYLAQASKTISKLLSMLAFKGDEPIMICKSYIFDKGVKDLQRKYGDSLIKRVKVIGEPQRLAELAYLDEIRNLGYEPLTGREKKRAKSFFHMLHWLEANPDRIKYAKTGWPRLSKYRLFRHLASTKR